MKYLLFIFFLMGPFLLNAQEKVEREFRVKASEVPSPAVEWLSNTFPKTRKLKWFFEETSGKQSYEAKFCYLKHRYSVEFSTEGVLEDVEREWKWKKLPKEIRQSLQSGFDKISGFQLQRIQEQWTGDIQAIRNSVQSNGPKGVTIRYEVEFLGRINGESALWEGLFTPEGELLSQRKIIIPNTDNLDF